MNSAECLRIDALGFAGNAKYALNEILFSIYGTVPSDYLREQIAVGKKQITFAIKSSRDNISRALQPVRIIQGKLYFSLIT